MTLKTKPRVVRAAIYIRVSSQEQERGHSLKGQYDDCRAYAKRRGYRIVRRFQDVASGRTLDRPGFRKLIDAAVAGRFDTLIVWRRDRFGRDAIHNGVFDRMLSTHGIRIESIQTGPRDDSSYTRFIDRLFDAVDELEAERISERCQMGRETAARSGIWPCRPLWGFRRAHHKGPLEADPETAPEVVQLFRRVAQGVPLRTLAAEMGRNHVTLSLRIRKTAYKGKAVYAGIEVPVPALVSPELWEAANRRLDDACRAGGRRPLRAKPTVVVSEGA